MNERRLDAGRAQDIQALPRHWAGKDVTTNDDRVDTGLLDLLQHCLEGGEVAMDIVDRRNS